MRVILKVKWTYFNIQNIIIESIQSYQKGKLQQKQLSSSVRESPLTSMSGILFRLAD